MIQTNNPTKHYIMHPHRQRLNAQNAKELAKELNQLSAQYGRYLFLKQHKRGHIEAIFAQQPGIVLGETIWTALGKPKNLIFCEQLSNQQYLLVIIQQGIVYLDTKLTHDDLINEVQPHLITSNKYHLYCYGQTPLSTDNPNSPLYSNDWASINHSERTLLDTLRIDPKKQCQPLEYWQKKRFRFKHPQALKIILAILCIGALTPLLFPDWTHSPLIYPTPSIAPMTKEIPAERSLIELAYVIKQCYLAPGWEPTHIHYQNGAFHIKMQSIGGSLRDLSSWSKNNQHQLHLSQEGPIITKLSKLSDHTMTIPNNNLNEELTHITDNLNNQLPKAIIQFADTKAANKLAQASFTLATTQMTPNNLILISQTFRHKNIIVQNVDLTLEDGFASGNTQFKIQGLANETAP